MAKFTESAKRLIARHGTQDRVGAIVCGFDVKASRHEAVEVMLWHGDLLYVEVRDTRLPYPVGVRALVTVDAAKGEIVPADTQGSVGRPGACGKQYSVHRRGWGAFVRTLVGPGAHKYAG